jgi:hypothetical protein
LVLIVMFLPRGIGGLGATAKALWLKAKTANDKRGASHD